MGTNRRSGPDKAKHIIILSACILLIAAIIFQQVAYRHGTVDILRQLEPETATFRELGGEYPDYMLLDKDGQTLGYAVQASASGYGGPISVFVLLAADGTIKKVAIAENYETPAYLHRVLRENYLQSFAGLKPGDLVGTAAKVDTVGGATLTTEGIYQAVRKGVIQVGNNQLNLGLETESARYIGWQEIGLLCFYVLTLLAIHFKWNKLRPWVLLGSVVFLGFTLNAALSLQNIAGLISGKLPSLAERPFWYILTFGVIGLTLLIGKNFYCSWLCPFGGLQEGLYKVLGFFRFQLPSGITIITKKVRWGLIWAALMLALIMNKPGIAGFEPFAVAFGGSGSFGQWLILCLVLVTAVLIRRVWCKFFCPVGAVLGLIADIRRKVKSWTLRTEHELVKPDQDCSKLSRNDVVYIVLIALYTCLIALTLLNNTLD